MHSRPRPRWSARRRVRPWTVGLFAALMLVVGVSAVAMREAASAARAADPLSELDCASGSDYVVGAPPLYLAEFETTESPEQLADRYAAEHALAARAGGAEALSRRNLRASSDRIDVAFRTADDRTVAVVSMEKSHGWKLAGSIACAKW